MEELPIIEAFGDYDPNTIDWQEEANGIPVNELPAGVVEAAVRAAVLTQDPFSWKYVDRDAVLPTKARMYRAEYLVPKKEDRAFIEANWPSFAFVWDCATKHIDHPVGHITRELDEIEMLADWDKKGVEFIDLFGNISRSRHYHRRCTVMASKFTSKDYLRYRIDDPRRVEYDLDALCDPNSVYGRVKNIAMTDSLYYLSLEKIGRILNAVEGRVMRARVFRHKETSGTLNRGEQKYSVSEEGLVRQTNVLTGEFYEHPSVEAMFHQFSAKTSSGGLAWTVRPTGSDAYLIEITGCPNEVCGEYVPLKHLQEQTWEEVSYNGLTVRTALGWTWMVAKSGGSTVRLEDLDLFTRLRRYVACKQRTPRLKTELANMARRYCNKEDIVAIHGGGASDIPIGQMADYVEMAFYVDVQHELEVALAMHRDNRDMVGALNKYYAEGITPKSFVAVTKVVNSAARAGAAAVRAVGACGVDFDETVRSFSSAATTPVDGSVAGEVQAEPDPQGFFPWGGW